MTDPVYICRLCLKIWRETKPEIGDHAYTEHLGAPGGIPIEAAGLELRGVVVPLVWAYAVRQFSCDVISVSAPVAEGQILLLCGAARDEASERPELLLLRSRLGALAPRSILPAIELSQLDTARGPIAIARVAAILPAADKASGWQLAHRPGIRLAPIHRIATGQRIIGGGETLFSLSSEVKRQLLCS